MNVIPQTLFCFLKIALDVHGVLWFHTNLRIVCSISVKNATGILIEISLNLYIVFIMFKKFKLVNVKVYLALLSSISQVASHMPNKREL